MIKWLFLAALVAACGAGGPTSVPATRVPTTTPTIAVTPKPTAAPLKPTITPTAAPVQPTVTPTAAPLKPTITPTTAPVQPTVTPTDSLTRAQENAIQAARDYLDYTAFSRSSLIGQLEYEGYSTADATFAVDSLDVDWEEQAYLSAKAYLDYSAFSLSGLIEQLEYEGFSPAQAKYGANKAYNE